MTAAVFEDLDGNVSVTRWYRTQKALTPSLKSARLAARSEAAAPAALPCSTLGEQKTVVLLMNQPSAPFQLAAFPVSYWQEEYFSQTPTSANSFFTETSYGQVSVTGDVFGPFDFDRDYACDDFHEYTAAAIDAARGAGVDFAPYTRVSVVLTPVGGCSYNAVASFGCSGPDERMPNEYSVSALITHPGTPSSTDYSGRIAHELGHNFGLTHSNSLDFGSIPLGALDYATVSWEAIGQAAAGDRAARSEYGDLYSTIGGSWMHHGYSARDKLALGWMPPADYQEVMGAGDFELAPFEGSSGLRAMRVLRDPTNASWLWLEYRQPIGHYDSDVSHVPMANVFTGALIRYEDEQAGGTAFLAPPLKLLHFNPSEAPNGFWMSTMAAGQSWSDPYSLLTLNVNQADSSGLRVSTTLDEPCAQLSATYTKPDLVIQVSAPDSCAWQASTAADWLTLTSAGSGRGNGSVAYRPAANMDTRQRRTYVTVQRQSIAVVQKGTGIFIHPLQNPHIVGNEARLTALVDFPGGITASALISADVGGCGLRASYSPFAPASLHTISNDHCTLSGAGSEFEISGDQIRVVWDVRLSDTVGSFPVLISAARENEHVDALVLGTWSSGAMGPASNPVSVTPQPLPADAGGGGSLSIGALLLLALGTPGRRRLGGGGLVGAPSGAT